MVAARKVLDWQQRLEDLSAEIEAASDECQNMRVRLILDTMMDQLGDIGIQLEDCSNDD